MSVKDQIRAALLTIHEKPLEYPEWGISGALLREFTARERQYANDAVQADSADPDQILFRAMLMQRCITDPSTGTAGPNGAIDPRTRTPIFTVEEVQELADGRAILFNKIWDDLIELAALGPQAMFSGNHADERAERDAGTGDAGTADATGADEDTRPGAADRGGTISGNDRALIGAELGSDA